METIPILAARIVFVFQNTFDRYAELVGYLRFEEITIDNQSFEIVFSSEMDRIIVELDFDLDERCWKIAIRIICKEAASFGLNQLLGSEAECECLVYKVHRSTLELILVRGKKLATDMVKDLIRYYKVLHAQKSYMV